MSEKKVSFITGASRRDSDPDVQASTMLKNSKSVCHLVGCLEGGVVADAFENY